MLSRENSHSFVCVTVTHPPSGIDPVTISTIYMHHTPGIPATTTQRYLDKAVKLDECFPRDPGRVDSADRAPIVKDDQQKWSNKNKKGFKGYYFYLTPRDVFKVWELLG